MLTADPVRIGFVSVERDAFKGDASALTERAARDLRALGGEDGYELVRAPESVADVASATRMGAWLAAQPLDLVVVLHATFATGDLLAPLLRAQPRVCVWGVPEREGLPLRRLGIRTDLSPLPLNSLCGLNMTLSLLEEPAVDVHRPVKWLWGAAQGDAFRGRWRTTVRALHGLRAVERARILQIGGTAPAFYRLDERPHALADVAVDTQPLL